MAERARRRGRDQRRHGGGVGLWRTPRRAAGTPAGAELGHEPPTVAPQVHHARSLQSGQGGELRLPLQRLPHPRQGEGRVLQGQARDQALEAHPPRHWSWRTAHQAGRLLHPAGRDWRAHSRRRVRQPAGDGPVGEAPPGRNVLLLFRHDGGGVGEQDVDDARPRQHHGQPGGPAEPARKALGKQQPLPGRDAEEAQCDEETEEGEEQDAAEDAHHERPRVQSFFACSGREGGGDLGAREGDEEEEGCRSTGEGARGRGEEPEEAARREIHARGRPAGEAREGQGRQGARAEEEEVWKTAQHQERQQPPVRVW
mmetsp:Transcript_17016/g.66324  ORF Transcript_17016/g.66324 Transcript_17016/m.66324 type:complete len:313 (+) Transcript_17016:1370-2308(+)